MAQNRDFVRQMPGADVRLSSSPWQFFNLDLPLMLFIGLLVSFGWYMLYSASDQNMSMMKRQVVFTLLGFVAMIVLAQVPPRILRMVSPGLFVFGLVLLVLVLFVGVGAKGAQRWLAIPGLPRFQPSELMKLFAPMTVAWYLARAGLPPLFHQVMIAAGIAVLPAMLIIKQPDLGTSILITASGMFVLFLAGLSFRLILVVLAVLSLCAPLIWEFGLHEYQRTRILTMLDPESDKLGAGWNIIQSKTAIGSGGFTGKGWMQGTQSHLDFLPESHTDFIVAVVAEELGFIGVLLVLLLYMLIVARGLFLAFTAQDNWGRLVASSISLTFFVYVFVNMGMVSGILPVVGVPLPLVSQGGTSIVSLLAAFGILMSIGTEQRRLVRR